MRVLVCGGRDEPPERVADWLQANARFKLGIGPQDRLDVIHGAAKGADKGAALWASLDALIVTAYPAQWRRPDGTTDRGAGPKRNRQMMAEGRPDAVIAFPGGAGTADMISVARAAGIEPILVRRCLPL